MADTLLRAGDLAGCVAACCAEDYSEPNIGFASVLARDLLEKHKEHALFVQLVEGCEAVDLDYRDQYFVFVASENGWEGPLGALLQHKIVDPTANNQAALRAACENGHLGCIELLLAHKRCSRPSHNGGEALLRAVLKGHEDVVRRLLAHGGLASSLKTGRPLECAAQEGHAPLVRLLLEDEHHGSVAVEARGQAALRSAARNGHADALKLILASAKADPGAKEGEALVVASAEGHARCVVELLCDERSWANGAGQRAYKEARERGRMEIMIKLADKLGLAGTTALAKSKEGDGVEDAGGGVGANEGAREGAGAAAEDEEAAAAAPPRKKAKKKR